MNETRILAAAEQVFAERGYSAASTASIAALAGLPKANLHYYFRTKQALYRRVIENVIAQWVETSDQISLEAEPKAALSAYIAGKIDFSRLHPHASKVFASEILHGAPTIAERLSGDLKTWFDAKCAVIEGWIAAGKMAPVDSRHLFFVLWAATQTYADFDVQAAALLGQRKLRPADFADARQLVTAMVLAACGLG
ncbi:MAG TPA: TetR/AcrR family transcriptional regulator [Dongiaceae bacterium]